MTFFDSIYDKLFRRNSQKSGILSHEPLKRSQKEEIRLERWYGSERHQELLKLIHHSYHLKKTDIEGDVPILQFNSVYANGMAIKHTDHIEAEEYALLLDAFKRRLIDLGYRQAGSDSKHVAKEGYVVSVDKYYMKPPLQTEPPINQMYGNISLELHFFNDQPNYMKIMASIYSDRLYQPHYDYDELVEELLISTHL